MDVTGIFFEIIVLLASLAAVGMNILFIQACDLLTLNENNGAKGTLGLFFYKLPNIHTNCVEITTGYFDNSTIDDWALHTGRICSLLALLFGAILLVFGFFQQCLIPLPCSQLLLDLSSSLIQLALVLVYLIWFSPTYCRGTNDEVEAPYQCTYGNGSLYLILCQVLWMVAGCFTRCMRPGRSVRVKRRSETA